MVLKHNSIFSNHTLGGAFSKRTSWTMLTASNYVKQMRCLTPNSHIEK